MFELNESRKTTTKKSMIMPKMNWDMYGDM